MLKVFDLAARAPREGGETVLGLKDLDTHACYMLYGALLPGEAPRTLRPGPGHEEIFVVISGAMEIKDQAQTRLVQAGQAFYLKGDQTFTATAAGPGEARYVAAGGHTPGKDHHH